MKQPIKLTVKDPAIIEGCARLLKTIDKGLPVHVANHLGQWWTLTDLHEHKDYGDKGPMYAREEQVLIIHLTALIKERLALCSKLRRSNIAKALQDLLKPEQDFWTPEVVASGEAAEITKALLEQFNL